MSVDAVKPERTTAKSRVAGRAAAVVGLGALACGACCVLPFALPAAVVAMSGGVLAWFAGAQGWMTALATVAVVGAWVWTGVQTLRTRRRPARSTLVTLVLATGVLALAMAWPKIEPLILVWIRG